jgi:ATP-dependent RNA helicase RhlB
MKTEFEILKLPEPVLAGIDAAGFTRMTPVQRLALPRLLAGEDVCAQAQTGTGKTATFLIAIFSTLLGQRDSAGGLGRPSALVIAPTRELALQIGREADLLGARTGLKTATIYGGEGYARQEQALRAGVDIVIGTPGRLLDFVRKRVLDLSKVRFLVIDEADRLLDMGFWDELSDILRRLPRPRERQSMLFSATLDHRTKKIASSHMNRPRDIAVRPEQITAEGIDQMVYHVDRTMKFRLLLGILSRERVEKGLIFANQKITVAWLARKLKDHGYDAAMLTGDLPQAARNRILERFKQGRTRFLVASDVASRGLHIEDVTHIINYDLPEDPEDYVHRIGRTARAGKRGKAYSLACDEYCYSLPEIEKLLGEPLPSRVPYDEDYAEDRTPEFTLERMLSRERTAGHAGRRSPSSATGPRAGRHHRTTAPPGIREARPRRSEKGLPADRTRGKRRPRPAAGRGVPL